MLLRYLYYTKGSLHLSARECKVHHHKILARALEKEQKPKEYTLRDMMPERVTSGTLE